VRNCRGGSDVGGEGEMLMVRKFDSDRRRAETLISVCAGKTIELRRLIIVVRSGTVWLVEGASCLIELTVPLLMPGSERVSGMFG
jgi:hypothetical protein